MRDNLRLKRRDFLRFSGVAALATIAAACQPAQPPAPTAPPEAEDEGPPEAEIEPTEPVEEPAEEAKPVGFQGVIEHYAQAYTPLSADTNPDPNAPKRRALDDLAEEWNDLHPGATIKFIGAPTGDYVDWLQTQLIGGTGPDVFWLWLSSLHDFVDEGKCVSLNDYLEMPNKYIPDDPAPWKEHFLDPFIESFSSKGNYGGVPMDLVSTGIYANLDLFEQAGIDLEAGIDPELGSPPDWVTFMEWHQKLQDAGIVPFSPSDTGHDWIWRILGNELCWNWLEFMDTLNYHDTVPMWKQEGYVSIEETAHQYWCHDWLLFEQPETQDMYRIQKEWAQYFPTDWTLRDGAAAFQSFATGKVAMLWEGTWQYGPLLDDDRREFEFSSFWLPPVTQETSEFVKDPPLLPVGVGGYGSIAYGLNRMCLQRGNVDECVDWLMYITTPENDELVVNEVPSFIPSVKKARALPEIANLFVGEARLPGGGLPIPPITWLFGMGGKYRDLLYRENDLYFMGEQTLEQTMANLTAITHDAAPEDIREDAIQYNEDGNWDLTQWDCQPEV